MKVDFVVFIATVINSIAQVSKKSKKLDIVAAAKNVFEVSRVHCRCTARTTVSGRWHNAPCEPVWEPDEMLLYIYIYIYIYIYFFFLKKKRLFFFS